MVIRSIASMATPADQPKVPRDRSRSPSPENAPDASGSDDDVGSSDSSNTSSENTYHCEVCGEYKESVGVLAEAVSAADDDGVERICLDCAYEHLEPDTAVEYVEGPEGGWRYCSVCSMHFSPSSDVCFADWRFPYELLTCARCREAWTLEGWSRKLEFLLNRNVERSGRAIVAGHFLSGQRLDFAVPVKCARRDLIIALELASGEQMAMWKVLSGGTLVASAADKYNSDGGKIVDLDLLGRGLTFLKGATKVNLRGGDSTDYGNDELAALIRHQSES